MAPGGDRRHDRHPGRRCSRAACAGPVRTRAQLGWRRRLGRLRRTRQRPRGGRRRSSGQQRTGQPLVPGAGRRSRPVGLRAQELHHLRIRRQRCAHGQLRPRRPHRHRCARAQPRGADERDAGPARHTRLDGSRVGCARHLRDARVVFHPEPPRQPGERRGRPWSSSDAAGAHRALDTDGPLDRLRAGPLRRTDPAAGGGHARAGAGDDRDDGRRTVGDRRSGRDRRRARFMGQRGQPRDAGRYRPGKPIGHARGAGSEHAGRVLRGNRSAVVLPRVREHRLVP